MGLHGLLQGYSFTFIPLPAAANFIVEVEAAGGSSLVFTYGITDSHYTEY
jgi:hypothetical protein